MLCHLEQQSPTILAPGTSFLEDNFSMGWEVENGFGMIQAHHIYCGLYFYYDDDDDVSFSSDNQALNPRSCGSLI